MNIAYQCSQAFLNPMMVSLNSFLVNNSDIDYLNLYILSPDFNDECKNKIDELISRYDIIHSVEIVKIPDFKEKFGFIIDTYNGKWGQNAFIRLCIDNFLPDDIDRILYLDSDTIICSSLKELWDTDLNNYYAAAVCDFLGEEYYDYFSLKKEDLYCNSGVILFNVKECKKNDTIGMIRNYLQNNNGFSFFMEQTVFNVVFKGKIKKIPYKYNVTTIAVTLNKKNIIRFRNPVMHYTWEEIDDAVKNPSILHMTRLFSVINRPWIKKCNYKYNYIFNKYSEQVSDFSLFEDKRSFKKKIIGVICNITPSFILYGITGYIYKKKRLVKYDKYKKNKMRSNEIE